MSEASANRRVIYKGRKIDLALQSVTLNDGRSADREVVLHRGAVALLPMVDSNHVCLVKNYRYTVGATLWEVPAGTIDPGESPEQTAARELTEETGYVAGRLRKLGAWLVSPGVFTERMHLFLCEELQPGPTSHQPDEQLEPTVVAWNEAVAMVEDGRIQDAKSMLAILLWDRQRSRLATEAV